MVEPILSTGLATDWLKRLHKLWSTLRKTRADELQEIRDVFGDPEFLARFYIEPDCQPVNPADHNEDESIRAFRQSVRIWLNRFLKGEFFERDGRNTVFVLSDAGMGKTSLLMMLKLTHLTRFWPDGLDFRLLKLGPDTLEKLATIQGRSKTVLLLDSLDEDSSAWGRIEERLMELLAATSNFRQVIFTCRTQFFPEGSAAPIEAPFRVVVGGYICNLLYLSPFDNAQVEAYLRKVYPNRWQDLARKWLMKEDNPKLARARKIVEPMQSLRMRPMLLARIDELLQSKIEEWREFPVYHALVRHWLLRELRKPHCKYTENQLWAICEEVAIFLQISGSWILSLEDLEVIQKRIPAAETLKTFDIGGRSLLNRTSDKGFRFSHYTIQEFLVARHLIRAGRRELRDPLRGTYQLVSFLFSWLEDSPMSILTDIPWHSLDLRDVQYSVNRDFSLKPPEGAELAGVYLRGSRLFGSLTGADLRWSCLEGVSLEGVDLSSADLRDVRLRGALLRNVDLRAVDARGVDFSNCSFIDSDLSSGHFAWANFEGATFESCRCDGAGFLGATGLSRELASYDELLGPPSLRLLRAMPDIERPASALAWLPQQGLLTIDTAGVALWASSGRVSRSLSSGSRGPVDSIAWTSDERFLFIASDRRNVGSWSLPRLELDRDFRDFAIATAVGCFGEMAVRASVYALHSRFPITIRDLQTDEQVLELEGHGQPVECLVWRPDAPELASAAVNGEIRIWGIRPEQKTGRLEVAPGRVVSLAWAPAGALLAARLENGSICLWHVDDGVRLPIAETLPPVEDLIWAPRGNRLALLCRSGEILVWDPHDKRQIKLPVPATAVAWHPTGQILAVLARQGDVEIWDIDGEVPRLLLALFEKPPVEGLVLTADGYVDGPTEALRCIRFADGRALYDSADVRHDPERVRQAMAAIFDP